MVAAGHARGLRSKVCNCRGLLREHHPHNPGSQLVHPRPRRADFRPRARAFPDGAAHRRPGADVLARLRAQAADVQPRRHRILHQRDPARRLRQDGRREPRRRAHRRAGRVPVEDQVAAVPGPGHGPGDEPGAGAGRDGGRALSGRRRPRVRGSSRWSSAPSRPARRRRRPGSSRATASSRSTAMPVETWEEFGLETVDQGEPSGQADDHPRRQDHRAARSSRRPSASTKKASSA